MNHNFTSEFFKQNRSKLCHALPNYLVVLSAHGLLQMSADQSFPFRQDSNFWYLCGIDEPDFVLVLDTSKNESTLLLPAQDSYHDEWDGAYDKQEFTKISGIKKFNSVTRLPEMLSQARTKNLKIGYLEPLSERIEPYGIYANPGRRILADIIKTIEPAPVDVRLILARLRQVKQPVEISAIQSAIDKTAEALDEVINSWLKGKMTEKSIENMLSMKFVASGGHAYEPIIASGKNAATIHYTKNNSLVENNAFLLLDIGARYNRYAADISRTWFVGSAISDRQKQLYDIVLKTQVYAFSELKAGVVLKEYQTKVEAYSKKLLATIGIVQDRYPHGISHFLGLDVHDAGDYNAPLEENTILTVEPGVYLPEESIGIRIEDNVRITKSGIEIMSKQIPSKLLYL